MTMTEDELLTGITEALTFSGWRWRHARRDDRAAVMGDPGLPDLIAVHLNRGIVLAWELKSERGVLAPDQAAWLGGFARASALDSRVVRPRDYDAALSLILRGSHHATVRMPDMPARELATEAAVLSVPSDAGPALYGLGSCSCQCYGCKAANHATP